MERFAKLALQALNSALESPVKEDELEIPPDPTLGDFGFPCFKLSKLYRKSPQAVAAELTAKISASIATSPQYSDLQAKQAGPYVNFIVSPQAVAKNILGEILQPEKPYGKIAENSRGSWVLEFSSPNVAKPFQIYHLRPTALGAALDRIGRYRGHTVVSINHLGDWGTQYGKLAVALTLFQNELPNEPTIDDLVKIYVKFHEAAEKQPELEDQAREAFLKLEKNDPQMIAIWKRSVDISLREFHRIYERIGVKFDHIWGESHYKDFLATLIDQLRKQKLLVESEGALVVPVNDEDGKEMPPCIIQKSDGATIYATRDLAAAIYRWEKFHFDRMTYIVGAEQKLHFKQVFAVLKRMGFDWSSRCEHVPTGLYRFKDAKMSTRKGNFVTFENVLGLAKERVETLMQERVRTSASENLVKPSDSDFTRVTEQIAIGAVIFHDLHTDPARDVDFDLERIVDFEGETGPYLQYAHTRCLSILRKAGEERLHPESLHALQTKEEIALIKTLGQFPIHLERSLKFAKASQLAHYLIDVTKQFGVFYRECRVLGEAPDVTRARLCLVEGTRRILAQGLTLLGVPLPDRM